jgi:hypothetical protein
VIEMAAKRKTKAQKAAVAEAKLAKEQAEALGAGREEAKDRTERKSAKPDTGPGYETATPSALALEKVGEAPELKHDNVAKVLEHGEKYQAEKKKHRWG